MKAKSTILIVDDEPVGRETLEGVLFGQGYDLIFAADGPETLAKAAEFVPDLILLDVMMPGMDGYEVCRRLRADDVLADVPVLMITALDDQDSCLKGLQAGADDFITKPFDRLKLRARVQTITRLNRYRRLLNERTRFEWVVEQASDGYVVVDDGDRIRYANPQARLYLGLHPLHPLQTEQPAQAIAPGGPPVESFLELAKRQYRCEPQEAWATWGERATGRGSSPHYLIRPEATEANAFWLQVDALDLPAGSSGSQIVRLRDITAQVARQRDMRGFHEAVTHKMRTPLTVMFGSLDLLAKHGDKMSGTDVIQLSTQTLRATERLRDTVQDILQYLNVSQLGGADARFSLDQLESLVTTLGSDLEIDQIAVSCPPDLQATRIPLSPQAIELALLEILENAKKFHPQRAPRVEIVATHVATAQFCLRISDDGLTVSPEHLAQIWTPYHQGEKDFTGEAKGMGLGLATVAVLVWQVGGACHAYNRQDGPGVTIELILPLEPTAEG